LHAKVLIGPAPRRRGTCGSIDGEAIWPRMASGDGGAIAGTPRLPTSLGDDVGAYTQHLPDSQAFGQV